MKRIDSEFKSFARSEANLTTTQIEDYSKHIVGMTPYIIEERQLNIAQMDVFSRLMMDRIIFLGTGIDDVVSNIITAQLLFLNTMDPNRDISLYINSPGGSVYDGNSIYDTMQYISNDVSTICTGMAASMGAILLSSGTKNKRFALPHSRVMIHQPLGGARGQASDMQIVVEEINKIKKELYDILSKNTGKSPKTIEKDADRDKWFKGEEAVSYGLIDSILHKQQPKKK
jgi:ATP-dependent Clp protease protease subunit